MPQQIQITKGRTLSYPQWAPSGRFISARGSGRLWVFEGGNHSWDSYPLSDQLSVAAWSPGRDELACVSPENAVVSLDYTSQPVLAETLVASLPGRTVSSVAWRPDGQLLAYGFAANDAGARFSGLAFVGKDGTEAPGQKFALGPAGDTKFAGWVGSTRYLYWHAPILSASIWADGVPLFEDPERRVVPCMLTTNDTVAVRPGHPDEVAFVLGGGRERWSGKRIGLARLPEEPVELANAAPGSLGQPAWSVEGSWLAYMGGPDTSGPRNDAASKGLAGRRVYVQDVPHDGMPQVLADDAAFRDERPTWLASGNGILFARIGTDGDASLWLWEGDKGGILSRLITGLQPPGVYETAGRFGYYGYVDWDAIFALAQPQRDAAGHSARAARGF